MADKPGEARGDIYPRRKLQVQILLLRIVNKKRLFLENLYRQASRVQKATAHDLMNLTRCLEATMYIISFQAARGIVVFCMCV